MARDVIVALTGNPNSGKTTVFNNLTGARQHVGNWPGVTVEKKEGFRTYAEYNIKVVDLPGVYSLTAYSLDEIVARTFIVDEKPDLVIDVVDASNLERNLYLTVQLLEMGIPLVIALNMMDDADCRGYEINVAQLSKLLDTPVVPMIASCNTGTEELLREIVFVIENPHHQREALQIRYGREIEEEIAKLENLIAQDPQLSTQYPARWLAVKLLEEDEEVINKFGDVGVE